MTKITVKGGEVLIYKKISDANIARVVLYLLRKYGGRVDISITHPDAWTQEYL